MASITQAQRSLSLTTPLGKDVLLLMGFSGTESLSRLFSYQLDLASSNDSIAAKDIVGKKVTWSVTSIDENPRYFAGIVSRFVAGSLDRRKLRSYRAEVVPWTWLLTRTTDCRIFQNQSTPDIIKAVFGLHGFSDFDFELKGSFPKREYCVQYRETAFNFISRLMEYEGIYYFFRHENGKHTMVLANATSSYTVCPESPIEYSAGSFAANHIQKWEHYYEFRSGKWTQTDYNFETPSTSLLTTTGTVIDLPDAPKYEIFDYPGEYVLKDVGDPVTKVRMEEEEASYNLVNASSQCCTFTPGGKFTLEGHDVGRRERRLRDHVDPPRGDRDELRIDGEWDLLQQRVHLHPSQGDLSTDPCDAQAHGAGSANGRGDRARRRGDLRRQVWSRQGAVFLGPPGQERRQELVLDPSGRAVGRQELGIRLSPADRPGGDR